jgi:uncharacterized protein
MKSSKYVWCGALLALPLMATTGLQGQTQATPKSTTQGAPSAPTKGANAGSASSGSATSGSASSGSGSAGSASTENTPPAHPITVEQTREMYELMGFKKTMNGMLMQTIAMQKQQAPFVPQDVWTDLQTSFDKVDYVSIFQPIYAKYLSQEDAAKALEFYRTPAGRHMLEVMPQLMHDIMLASQQKGQQVGREVIDRHRAEIEAAQKKYQQEHEPQPAAPASGPGTSGPGASPSLKTPPAGTTPSAPPSGSTTTPTSPKQ